MGRLDEWWLFYLVIMCVFVGDIGLFLLDIYKYNKYLVVCFMFNLCDFYGLYILSDLWRFLFL